MNVVLSLELDEKWKLLTSSLCEMGSVVVAFSGGVDSGLLAAAAYEALGEKMLAVTIHSPVDPPGEQESAEALARQLGFTHEVVEMNDLENPDFVSNSPERCYFCKKTRLSVLQRLGKERGFQVMVEGSNADDRGDYRPGKRAVHELGIRSPLEEAGFAKQDIRAIARDKGLVVWDRPSAPCLATRFPYGTIITPEGLERIAQAESYLSKKGFQPVRVRFEEMVARIEVAPESLDRLLELRIEVIKRMKEIGFKYTVVDLEGYRSGSMNEVLK